MQPSPEGVPPVTDARAHFGAYASAYRAYRPAYPEPIYDLVAEAAPRPERVWDCGSGSGQAATGLAGRFALVIATDLSAAQLGFADRGGRIVRIAAAAESAPLAARSVDAVTVAQALHWFDFEPFFAEVARVCAPGGVFAAWSYGLVRVAPDVDRVLDRLHGDILGGWWLPRRRHVDEAYARIRVPFEPIDVRVLDMVKRLSFADLLGYLDTWSAGRTWREAHGGRDPVEAVREALEAAWIRHAGATEARADLVWPVTLRRFRVG